MRPRKLLQRLRDGHHANVGFRDFQLLLEACGPELDRVMGSHHIYVHAESAQKLSVQNVKGDAKPYQLRQFLQLAERYALIPEDFRVTDHINLFYSDQDGGYIADIPDLEACSAFGSSPSRGARRGVTRQGGMAAGRPRPGPRDSAAAVPSRAAGLSVPLASSREA